MAQPEVSTILDRDFVVAKIDIERMTAGNEVMLQYRSDSSGGIPWYVILDAKGKKLATADDPGKNIGYPYSPQEIDQFMALVGRQAHRIDASGLDQLRKSLNENADKIKKPARPERRTVVVLVCTRPTGPFPGFSRRNGGFDGTQGEELENSAAACLRLFPEDAASMPFRGRGDSASDFTAISAYDEMSECAQASQASEHESRRARGLR